MKDLAACATRADDAATGQPLLLHQLLQQNSLHALAVSFSSPGTAAITGGQRPA